MLSRPVVDLVNELHWLGRRLAVLKRLYQSYELIMMRILQRQRTLREEARPPTHHFSMGHVFEDPEFAEMRQSTMQSGLGLANVQDTVGVQLSQVAVTRFERLLDRIKLYCLSEIDSCLTEKESLTFLVSEWVPFHCSADEAELQPHRAERHAGGGKADEDHDPAGQSDDLVPASQPDDGVLFDGAEGGQGGIHDPAVLGVICSDHGSVGGAAGVVWDGQ